MENESSSRLTHSTRHPSYNSWSRSFGLLKISALFLVILAIVFYKLDSFDPSALPPHALTQNIVAVPKCNSRMLKGAEMVGSGELLGPEDIAYDSRLGFIYTGCADGWVKRVRLNDSVSVVESWVYTGGRPLGIVLGLGGEVIVADADKGLVKINEDGVVKPLTDEADGLKFKLTDGVDVAKNGVIYFTDASFKYSVDEFIFDILEGKPQGRFMSYDPITKQTEVLIRNLYFPNGVAVSPTQDFVIFCETPLRRCRKYYIAGDRKGNIEKFVDDLPGPVDNIRYDGNGHYWIGLSTVMTTPWHLALKYPVIRKVMAMAEKYLWLPKLENSGVVAVDLEGKPIAHYYDYGLSLVTSGLKIGNHLYCGSLALSGIIRLDLDRFPALAAGCRPSKSDL